MSALRSTSLAGRLVRAGLILSIGLVLGACAIDPTDLSGRRQHFEESQRKFSQLLRWGQVNQAARFVVPDQRREFMKLGPDMSDLQFSDYEILYVDLAEDRQQATVDVRYSAFHRASLVTRDVSLSQEWKIDETGEWQVTLDLEHLRTALLP